MRKNVYWEDCLYLGNISLGSEFYVIYLLLKCYGNKIGELSYLF